METYCLLDKLKETIQSDFRGKKLRFISSCRSISHHMYSLRNSSWVLIPTVSSSFSLIYFCFYFVERVYFEIYFKVLITKAKCLVLNFLRGTCRSGRESRPDLSQKLRSYMHEFYFAGLEEKCNEANSKIQDLEIENSRVKKLNNHLQEENAGYTF